MFRGQLKQLLHEFCMTALLEGCCPTCKSLNFKSMECHMLIFSLSTTITECKQLMTLIKRFMSKSLLMKNCSILCCAAWCTCVMLHAKRMVNVKSNSQIPFLNKPHGRTMKLRQDNAGMLLLWGGGGGGWRQEVVCGQTADKIIVPYNPYFPMMYKSTLTLKPVFLLEPARISSSISIKVVNAQI